MKQKRNGAARRRTQLPAQKIHTETVRAYVLNHCCEFSWSNKALGALRAQDWKALLELAEHIDESLMCSAPADEDPHTEYGGAQKFLRASQFVALVKKYQYPNGLISGLDPDAKALAKFCEDERRNARTNKIFRAHRDRGTFRHWSVPLVQAEFLRVLGDTPFIERILDKCDFSGGASTSHTGKKTHLAAKLGGDQIRGTATALPYFKLAMWRNFNYGSQFMVWRTLDKGEKPEDKTLICCVDRDVMVSEIDKRFDVCEYNNIKVVAKTAGCGRTIAAESEVNNCLQKGVDIEMRELLRSKCGVDLRYQGTNQKRARRGASEYLSPFCDATLDVRSASNGVLTECVRTASPPRWFQLWDDLRAHSYKLPDGSVRPYEMFCSMGNGFCFPLETLLFYAICKAAYTHCGIKPDHSCYGDDIVVRRDVALVVIECLKAWGFRLNTSKSYVFGPFRESCGANSYGGQEVTPGYFKEPITSESELYAQHNSLHLWPEVQAVMRRFASSDACVVPRTYNFTWITNQAFVVPLDVAMTCNGVYWSRRLQSWQSTVQLTQPVGDTDWRKTFHGSDPEGMALTAVLRGSEDPEQPFHLRHCNKLARRRTDAVTSPRGDPLHTDPYATHVILWALHKKYNVHHRDNAVKHARTLAGL